MPVRYIRCFLRATTRIANCEIYNLPGMAIYLHGNDHIIEYNKIHHVLQSVSDSGAIYMGRDMSEVGNIIRHNFRTVWGRGNFCAITIF